MMRRPVRSFSYYGGAQNSEDDIIIVNRLGILGELYGIADYAYVGGGMHHRVHNVLEPALHKAHVAFGPKYHTSPEAEDLVEHGFAKVVRSKDDFGDWLRDPRLFDEDYKSSYQNYIVNKLGATSKINNFIKQIR